MNQTNLFINTPQTSGATFSPCRKYRYDLWRVWDDSLGRVAFIGLNPSTADEHEDDPTIRRCISFAKSWGFGGIHMRNLFAYRATDPRDMRKAVDPVGPDNDKMLLGAPEVSEIIIAAWGVHGKYYSRAGEVLKMLLRTTPIQCLGITKDGYPKHPLYLSSSTQPRLFMSPYVRKDA